jgi:ferredoxin
VSTTSARTAGSGAAASAGRDGSAGQALMVDWTACDGRGLCVELLPELLEADPWGYPKSRGAAPGGGALAVVPDHLAAAAKQAVNLCPLLALRLQLR